jgi:isocitrate dehydrogenase (NAD+)
MYNITLIPGDGIGPEVAFATKKLIDATGVKIDWDVQEAGEKMINEHGSPLPHSVIESVRKNKIALKGPITTPVGEGFRSVNVALRKEFDLLPKLGAKHIRVYLQGCHIDIVIKQRKY